MNVDEIKLGATDAAGAPVEIIYARRKGLYVVYRTRDRIMVHFCDTDAGEGRQRAILNRLNPLRGEINGLIDGWRMSQRPSVRARVARYERRVADALAVALEGDPETAQILLEHVKRELYEERVSWARFQYLLVASATAGAVLFAIFILSSGWYQRAIYDFGEETGPLWLAAGAGTLGAFFSIATGIRSRTVLPDLRLGDNSADAMLRVVVGLIGATVLVFLLQSGVVATPSFGNQTVDSTPAPPAQYSWAMVVVVGFIAGFLERLVPDLLGDNAIARIKAAAPGTAAAATAATEAARTPAESSPSDRPASAVDGQPAAPPAAADEPAMDETEDDCVDRFADGVDVTPDEDLPAARGGVATMPT